MAKKSAIEKNKSRRKLVAAKAQTRLALKATIMDKSLPQEERYEAVIRLAEMPRNSARTRIRNRCDLTGRPRSYYRKLGLSRIALRDLASDGQIPGMVKSSW